MANKKLFSSRSSLSADTVNHAGGIAYSLENEEALAKFAMTGCFTDTFYVKAENQLNKFIEMTKSASPEFLARLAVYSRKNGYMKDMPALLTAILSTRDHQLFCKIFNITIDSPKMLRVFVQMVRSGVSGRKSLGTRPKKMVANYLESLTDEQLFKANIGTPSLNDLIKLSHPKPATKSRSALYSYLMGKKYDDNIIPLVKEFEEFKANNDLPIPNVPFQMLTAQNLSNDNWKEIATNATWTQTRMNLNTFARHGVFKDAKMTKLICDKLENKTLIAKSNVMPYEVMAAFLNINLDVPSEVSTSLQLVLEESLNNVPTINGKVHVMVDVSGSMSSPITGYSGSATSSMRCIDVAALFASSLMRKNVKTNVVPFDTKVHNHKLNPFDSVLTNAQILSEFGGGGTSCSCALAHLNKCRAEGDVVIYISDNESHNDNSYYGSTSTMNEWVKFKKMNPNAKLINIDITPHATTQVMSGNDILNIGGFNDNVFSVISRFIEFGTKDSWVKEINSIKL